MKTLTTFGAILGLTFGLLASNADAQRGMGDPEGIVRQGVRPEVSTLSGKLIEVRTGTCESTTGRFPIGTHLILETPQGDKLNIHLGPAPMLAETVNQLSAGQPLTVTAFRTEKMPEKHYVAQTLTFGDTTVRLRDENLRPVWAGGRGAGAGRGPGMGPGWGRGYGRGAGGRGAWQ